MTPQGQLADISDLLDSPKPARAPRRAPKPVSAPKPTPTPASLSDISDLVDAAPKAPASPKPASPSHPYGAMDSLLEGRWSSATGAEKVKSWYKQTYGRDLPVTAPGQSRTHNARGLDHSDSLDVGVHPASAEGKALRDFLRSQGYQYLAFDRASDAATGPHIHIGHPSRKGDEVGRAAWLGSVSDLLDDPADISDLVDPPESSDPLAGRDVQPGEEVVREVGPARTRRIDPYTMEGRAERNRRREAEKTGGGQYRVPVGSAVGAEAVREAAARIAEDIGATTEFVVGWMRSNTREQGLFDTQTGAALPGSSPTGYATVPAEVVGRMREDWRKSRGVLGRAVDAVTDSSTSAGEKLLSAAGAPVEAAKGVYHAAANTREGVGARAVAGAAYKAVGEPVLKAIDAGDSYVMAKAMGYGDVTAHHFAEMIYAGIPNPAENPGGELLANVPLLSSNPRWQKGARAFGSFVLKPSNLVPVPEVSALLRAGKLGRAVEEGSELAMRVARAVGMADRGLVEAAPLGLLPREAAQGLADDALEVIARADDGTHHLVNVSTGEAVNLETGVAIEVAGPPKGRAALEAEGYTVKQVDAPNRAAGEEVGRKVWKVTDPDGRSNIMRDDGELDDFAARVAGRSPAAGALSLEGAELPRPSSPSQNVLTRERATSAQDSVGLGLAESSGAGSRGMIDEAGLRRKAAEHNMPLEDVRAEAVRQGYAVEPPPGQNILEAPTLADPAARLERLALEEGATDEAFASRVRAEADALREGGEVPPPAQFRVTRKAPSPGSKWRGVLPSAESPFRRVLKMFSDVVQAPKGVAGFDFSITGRQGLAQSLAHPTYFKEGVKAQARAFASEDAFKEFVGAVRNRPDFDLITRTAKVELTSPGMGGPSEEIFASKLIDKLPGGARSKRAASAGLDTVRLAAWDNYADFVHGRPHTNEKTYEAIGRLINRTTGRARVPALDRFRLGRQVVEALNVPFFSPRNTVSKFSLLSPVEIIKDLRSPATRPVAWLATRDALRGLTVFGTTLGLLYFSKPLTGMEVGIDPRRPSEFGKVRLGKAVFDLTAGSGPALAFTVRMFSAFDARARGIELEERETPEALTAHYLRTQLQPLAGSGVDWKTGETLDRKEFTYAGAAGNVSVPLVVRGFYDGWVAYGGSTATDLAESAYYNNYQGLETGFSGLPFGVVGVAGPGVNFYDKPGERDEAARQEAGQSLGGKPKGIAAREESERIQRAVERTSNFFSGLTDAERKTVLGLRVYVEPAESEKRTADFWRAAQPAVTEEVRRLIGSPGFANLKYDSDRATYLKNMIRNVLKREQREALVVWGPGGDSEEEGETLERRLRGLGGGDAAPKGEIVISGAAGDELKRHGLRVEPESDGKRVSVSSGESVGFRGSSLGQTPEHLEAFRRELAAETQKHLDELVSRPAYREASAQVQKRALERRVSGAERIVRRRFFYQTRERNQTERQRLQDYQRRLEGRRGAGVKPGETLKLGAATGEIRRAVARAKPDAEPTFRSFPEGMGDGPKLPRSSMPQVKGEHRGAMVNFLRARGISHTRETVAAGSLKPSQAEYSPEKVKRAQGYDGPQRALLVSSDGHVADGHHQWLSDLAKDPRAPVDVIRLDAPILPLLMQMARFPSSGEDRSSASAAVKESASLPGEGKPPLTRDELRQMAKAEGLTVAEVAREARAQGYSIAA